MPGHLDADVRQQTTHSARLTAETTKIIYDAFVAEGFTFEEAIALTSQWARNYLVPPSPMTDVYEQLNETMAKLVGGNDE